MALDYAIYNDLVEEKKSTLLNTAKLYLKREHIDLIKLAITVASHAHFGQTRKSGEPYITHPLEVASIIADWKLDETTIVGAILHDVIEDTNVSKIDLARVFGPNIAELVDGVTKLEKLHFESEEIAHAEYFRKVVLAMAKDIRVILIKLADRLHNMLTLGAMRLDKRQRIALETMEVYVPIANRIGVHRVHLQLASECMKHLHPWRYRILSRAMEVTETKISPIIDDILNSINSSLKSTGIQAEFYYRKRSLYKIYSRMKTRRLSFKDICNIFDIKIITRKIGDCYLVLGILHNLYRPLPGRFKDYIAIPKGNGYQSLHSTLMGPSGNPLEIHIRTDDMEDIAENGIISHWLKGQYENQFTSAKERTNNWINNILDIQSSTFSANDFVKNIKQDLSPVDIYVFTPKGKVILLPRLATPLDFAYYIHSNVGNHCSIAKVNQKAVKFDTRLHNGDIVEIITNKNSEPDETWLDIVVSGKAVSKIKQYLKEQKYDEDLARGEMLIQLAITMFDSTIKITNALLNDVIIEHYPKLSIDDLKHQIGIGGIPILKIVRCILGLDEKEILVLKTSNAIMPLSQDQMCLALPGDKIYAKITHHKEIVIHRHGCKNVAKSDFESWIPLQLVNDNNISFATKIQTFLVNQPGIFNKLTQLIADRGMNMLEIAQETHSDEFAIVTIKLGVKNRDEVDMLLDDLSKQSFINAPKLL